MLSLSPGRPEWLYTAQIMPDEAAMTHLGRGEPSL